VGGFGRHFAVQGELILLLLGVGCGLVVVVPACMRDAAPTRAACGERGGVWAGSCLPSYEVCKSAANTDKNMADM
jgi:hypothetical protein